MANKNFKVKNGLEVKGSINVSNLELLDEYPDISPTLHLDFVNSKTLDPRITFTRASKASYYDSDGLLKLASDNVARFDHDATSKQCKGLLIEESRTNLLTYSENFDNAAWVKRGTCVVVPNDALAPDGTYTADKITFAGGTNDFYYGSLTIASGTAIAPSIYIKKSTASGTVKFTSANGLAFGDWEINLALLSTSWERITSVHPAVSVITAFTGTGNAFSGFIIYTPGGSSVTAWCWGAQVEVGSFTTSYIPSTDTFTSRASTATYIGSDGLIQSAAINEARYQYNPLNLALAPKLLLEESRTNLLTYSEQFNTGSWAKVNTSIVINSTTAPDGTLTADKLVETGTFYHSLEINSTVLNSNSYTESIFLKAAERTQCHILFYDSTAYYGYKIDLSTGIVSSSSVGGVNNYSNNAIVTNIGNGWYRCSLSKTMTGTTHQFQVRLYNSSDNYTGDGTSGIYIWGAQLEQGSYPTSYIPTTTTALTRSADVSSSFAATRSADLASMIGTNFSDWYRQDEGTIQINGYSELPPSGIINVIADIGYGGNFGTSYYFPRSSNGYTVAPNAAPVNIGMNGTINEINFKLSAALKNDSSAFCTNGSSTLSTDSSSILPSATTLKLGRAGWADSNFLNGHISKFVYYPERLNNTILQNLTK